MNAASASPPAAPGPEAARAIGEIRATAGMPRAEAIAAMRTSRATAVAALVERMMTDFAAADGVRVCGDITAITDAIVSVLVEGAGAQAAAQLRDPVGV